MFHVFQCCYFLLWCTCNTDQPHQTAHPHKDVKLWKMFHDISLLPMIRSNDSHLSSIFKKLKKFETKKKLFEKHFFVSAMFSNFLHTIPWISQTNRRFLFYPISSRSWSPSDEINGMKKKRKEKKGNVKEICHYWERRERAVRCGVGQRHRARLGPGRAGRTAEHPHKAEQNTSKQHREQHGNNMRNEEKDEERVRITRQDKTTTQHITHHITTLHYISQMSSYSECRWIIVSWWQTFENRLNSVIWKLCQKTFEEKSEE